MNAPMKPLPPSLLKSLGLDSLRMPALPGIHHRRKMWAPIIAGCTIIVVLIIGLGVWASVTSIDGAVSAPGFVTVENNRKSIRAYDSGIVREILVREGDSVKANQVLIRFDRTGPRAQLAVLQNQYDLAIIRRARYEAELENLSSMPVPAELKSRLGDPAVARLVGDEQEVFRSRLLIFQTKAGVLRQRIEQMSRRARGIDAQLDSQREQSRLVEQELEGLTDLYKRGYAPRTRVLALQRNAASLKGNAGEQEAAIASTQAQIGEATSQLAELRGERLGEAAEAIQVAEAKVADVLPRLDAARASDAQTEVRSPVDGYVLNLTQFTEGGVVKGGELMLDVVPVNVAMVVEVKIKPQYVNSIRPGQAAKIQLSGYSSRVVKKIPGIVRVVAADRTVEEKSGQSFFNVEITVKPEDVVKAGSNVKLYPGMPATAHIVTGERTIMEYLIGPMRDAFAAAMKET